MVANIYIMAESFQYNSEYIDSVVEEKAKRLAEDVRKINTHKESNKIFANYSTVYPIAFNSKFTVEDFLCRPIEVKRIVDRDVVNALLNIFERAVDTNISSQEVIETLLPWHDKTICHGLIAFHKIDGVPGEAQLIYGIDNWFKFRRHFLGLYPEKKTFIDECRNYFPNILIHEQNKVSVLDIIEDFSNSIVKHLEVLNDVFYTYRKRNFENESVKYQTLTSECNLEESAASKDNNDSKDKLTFKFINDDGQIEEVTCYSHLRLCKSDNVGDSHYYHNRIYFHEGIPTIKKGKILIGQIGLHRKD